MKKIVVFDLDGTLTESKSPLDSEMSYLLCKLLKRTKVAIISGGNYPQYEKQVLSKLPECNLVDLFLLPTCGTKFYKYENGWVKLYSEDFTCEEKKKIIASMEKALEISGFQPEQQWGELIEDRGSQITFSALGQEAPPAEKKKWDADFSKRQAIKKIIDQLIPEFSTKVGGHTSIDVTKLGIDKAYGIRKLSDLCGIAIKDMMFIGDALFPGGNDYPARETGIDCIQVRDHIETNRVIEAIVCCLGL